MLQITSFHSPVSKFPYLQGRRLRERERERERGAAIYRKEARCLGPYLYVQRGPTGLPQTGKG
ncbi:hypothetical protein BDE02_17G015100 [Populus trichocarpa]|nr:hypothetical protein BDE02_17G015100 [Populus trichocarpa]